MSDVNNDIANLNAALAGTGLRMDEIHGGLGVGVAFGIELPTRVSFGLAYDRLGASTDVADSSASITYDFPANAFRAFGQYSFSGAGAAHAHVGGSLGLIQEAGSVGVAITDGGFASEDIHGSSLLLELFTGGDFWAGPQFALSASAGYRHANVGEIKVNGSTVYLSNGEKYSIDYSGVFIRAGIKVALTR